MSEENTEWMNTGRIKEILKENENLQNKIYKYEELVGSLFMDQDGRASFQGSQGDLDYFNKSIEAIGEI